MGLLDKLMKKEQNIGNSQSAENEFCPRCDANLTLQKGYSNDLPYWNCKGCGEMLYNPLVDAKDDIVWVCDKCEAMLNLQQGFDDNDGKWVCRECGFENVIDESEIYLSEDEFQATASNPYRGLSDDNMLELLAYTEKGTIGGHDNVVLVEEPEDGRMHVKKILSLYDKNVYDCLQEHPIKGMPRIEAVYESDNNLIVIEEYIEGKTLKDILEAGTLNAREAVEIAIKISQIAKDLHMMQPPIIHRDIKPSNIIIDENNAVWLLDINAAKVFKPEEIEDTMLLGTKYYAAPEQLGFGLTASSPKTDVYAIGVLLNVMITGRLPKEEKAEGTVWEVIDRCIRLNADERYTDEELISTLAKCR